MSPNGVIAYLRRRWAVLVSLVAVLAFFAWLADGAVEDGRDRREARARIEGLAQKIDGTTDAIKDATSPAATARSNARLAQILNDVRRSIDCAELYGAGEQPPACMEVAARLDAIRAGADPFAPTPGGTP